MRQRQGNGHTKIPGVDFGHSHRRVRGIGLDAVDVSTQIVCSYHLQTICNQSPVSAYYVTPSHDPNQIHSSQPRLHFQALFPDVSYPSRLTVHDSLFTHPWSGTWDVGLNPQKRSPAQLPVHETGGRLHWLNSHHDNQLGRVQSHQLPIQQTPLQVGGLIGCTHTGCLDTVFWTTFKIPPKQGREP